MKKMQFLFFLMKNMLRKFLGFGHMQQNIFSFWKCFEIFFFWNISEKTRYFNTGFVFYSVNIQPDIMYNW
jgi:hypothetical protein